MNGMNDFRRTRIGVVEIIIIINAILFLPKLLGYYNIFDALFNLNIRTNSSFNFDSGAYWQALSAMFMHSERNFMHIVFNMYGLYIFGKPLEIIWGKGKFFLFYMITGLLTNIASALIFIMTDSSLSLLGASGAVFAVLLAFASYYPDARLLLFFFIPLKVKWTVLLFTGIELFSELFVRDGVAHFAHLFGFLFAFLYLLLFFRINAIQKMFFPDRDHYNIY